MRLTPRGYVAASVVALAVVSAALFGARGLNAIAAPGAVALAYAALQVRRLDRPAVRRELPRHGDQGSTVRVELDIDVARPHGARLVDAVDEGLDADGNDREVALGAGPVGYDLFLKRRGERTVGPVTIESRDVLGLVSRTFEVGGTGTVLVRPRIYPLSGSRADEIVWLFGGGHDRREFDFLRYYRRGDPLRDIHWRTSAKVPTEDFVVKEFSTGEGVSSVRLAAESAVGHADEMAAATASIATHLLAAGLRVGLMAPDCRLAAQGGVEQRERVLDALARSSGGAIRARDREDAAVIVTADADGVTVELTDGVTTFAKLAGREVSVPSRDTPDGDLANRLRGMT